MMIDPDGDMITGESTVDPVPMVIASGSRADRRFHAALTLHLISTQYFSEDEDNDDEFPINVNDLLKSSMSAIDELRKRRAGLHNHFRVSLRGLAGEDGVNAGAAAIDGGGPFQNWLGRLANLLFAPSAALFLPAKHDGRTWARISPRPGLGCVEPSVASVARQRGHLELYRLADNVLGLALRPRRLFFGVMRGAHAPFVLGDAARLVPSVCRQLLLGDGYAPSLHDLRSPAPRAPRPAPAHRRARRASPARRRARAGTSRRASTPGSTGGAAWPALPARPAP